MANDLARRMLRGLMAAALGTAFGTASILPADASDAQPPGFFHFYFGGKLLGGEWKENSIGLDLTKMPSSGFSLSQATNAETNTFLAIDGFRSRDASTVQGVRYEGATTELDVGVRYIFKTGPTTPYVGCGPAYLRAKQEASQGGVTAGVSDKALGWWINAGVFWPVTGFFRIGIDARVSRATARFRYGDLRQDVEAGGEHLGIVLGFGW